MQWKQNRNISYQRPSNTESQEKLEGSRILRLVENNYI